MQVKTTPDRFGFQKGFHLVSILLSVYKHCSTLPYLKIENLEKFRRLRKFTNKKCVCRGSGVVGGAVKVCVCVWGGGGGGGGGVKWCWQYMDWPSGEMPHRKNQW